MQVARGMRLQLLTTDAYYDPCEVVDISNRSLTVSFAKTLHDDGGNPSGHGTIEEVVPIAKIRRMRELR